MTQQGFCRSCGAPVIWCKTTSGKQMPVDAKPSEGGNIEIDAQGVAVYLGAGKGTHVSHFATCPNGHLHRKR